MDRSAIIKAGMASSSRCRAVAQRRAERLEQFRLLCESGASREDIARTLGVSEMHVGDHARDHGFTVPPITRPHARHGLKPGQTLGKRKQKGTEMREEFDWTPARIKIYANMRVQGATREDIANALGTTVGVVRQKIRKASRGNKLPPVWTPDREKMLHDLWLDPLLSASKVADLINAKFDTEFSRNAIIGAVHRRGYGRRTAPPAVSVAQPPAGTKTSAEARAELVRAVDAKRQADKRAAAKAARLELARQREEEARQAAEQAKAMKPEPEPEPVAIACPVEPEPISFGVSIFDLTLTTCRWPLGAKGEIASKFCGHKCDEAHPYCDHHSARAYQTRASKVRIAFPKQNITPPSAAKLDSVFEAFTS